ncbi:MAG TPA: hypothetical protein VEB42_01015 [Chitinophagaceae bacterium]|nr:hypothetical protein [Chitinophagaceae bacterium]
MNKPVKYAFVVAGSNLVLFLLLIFIGDKLSNMDTALFVLLAIPAIILLLELILGIVFMAATNDRKDLGAGLLIGFGITLLIGLGVCGVMASM